MHQKKILAYFMHEYEDHQVAANVSNATKTDSFYLADATDEQIKTLRDSGIILQVISGEDKSLSADTSGLSGNAGFRSILIPSVQELEVEATKAGFPAYYLFSVNGPLLENYQQQLRNSGIDILERIPKNSYLIRISTEEQHSSISLLPFVQELRYYNSKDTGVVMITREEQPLARGITKKQMLKYDILLHRHQELNKLLNWLKKKKIKIIGSGGYKIRILLFNEDKQAGEIAANPLVRSVEQYIPPEFHNDIARQITGIESFQHSTRSVSSFTGKGVIVGIADTGIDDSHPDLEKKIIGKSAWGRKNDSSDPDGHGTHVAGSIAGDGSSSAGKIKGTAPGAQIFFQSIMNEEGELNLPLQVSMLFEEAYKKGVRVHNNSWGSSTASKYTISSIEVDDFASTHKDMLLVFSAGNDGSGAMPVNVQEGFADFLSIGSPASAKNVLTVGASRSSRTDGGYAKQTYGEVWPDLFPFPPLNKETISGNIDSLAAFSSRGPCDDNRIKPDIVGPGTDIVSTKSRNAPLANFWGIYPPDPNYAIMGGTSMAAPIVAGCAAVVSEYFIKARKHLPSSALLKATLINGAKKMNGPDCTTGSRELPNFNQGFGLIDMTLTIPGSGKNISLDFYDNYREPASLFKITGQRRRYEIIILKTTWLRICMAYTDVPGRSLQNNLNLMLDYKGKKWLGNEHVPSLLKMPDATNNVETIIIEAAKPGIYTLQISVTNLIKGPQDFALVITTGDTKSNSKEKK